MTNDVTTDTRMLPQPPPLMVTVTSWQNNSEISLVPEIFILECWGVHKNMLGIILSEIQPYIF